MKRKCFVLMPFADEYRQVFDHAIKPAAENTGFDCFRADDPIGPRNIISDIVEALFKADIIVADLTGFNPNVFYELGIAHSIANKTVMICEQTNSRLPFDLASYRTIFYDRTIDGISMKLRGKLEAALRTLDKWSARPTNPLQDFRPIYYAVPLGAQAELEEKVRTLEAEAARLRSEAAGKPPIGSSVLIPSGNFLMGLESGQNYEKPVHEVSVDAFLIDVYPVTNGEFKPFVEECPERRKEAAIKKHMNVYYLFHWQGERYPHGKRDHPVVWVNWYAAAAYCNWRSRKKHLEPCYAEDDNFSCDFSKNGFRLPTEAEFEKAVRGGIVGQLYPWGNKIDESKANYSNVVGDTTEVGKYPPTQFGTYDLVGNVKEWCNDWFSESWYGESPLENPRGPEEGEFKVFRGGSWGSPESELKCGIRSWLLPPNTNPDFGFRCVRRP